MSPASIATAAPARATADAPARPGSAVTDADAADAAAARPAPARSSALVAAGAGPPPTTWAAPEQETTAAASPEAFEPPIPHPTRGPARAEPPSPAWIAAAPRVEAAPPRRATAPAAATTGAASGRDEASAPVSQPDVVHVTIGRIDVRATVAPPAGASRAARPPRDPERSLHDYLAGRPR